MPESPATSADPAVHLLSGGRRIVPVCASDSRFVFLLPDIRSGPYLCSRHARPNATRPWMADDRQLGVMVRRITLRHGPDELAIPLDDPALTVGWWAVERQGEAVWRWTDGHARLVLPPRGTTILQIELAGTLVYPRQSPLRGDSLAA